MKIPFISQRSNITFAGHIYDMTDERIKKFTLKSRFGDKVELFKELKDNKMMVPIHCGVSKNDRRVDGVAIDFTSSFVPRSEEQSRITEKSTDLLINGDSHILEAATGFGKTIIGTEIAGRVGKKFLVIVPKEDVVGQWVDAFKIVLGLDKSEIGLIQGDTCTVAGKKAVIGMVHSVCKDGRYPSWIYKEFGLIIVDECHVISAKTFSNAMWLLPAKLKLGLSATPYRQDGKDFVFYSHIGKIKCRSKQMTLIPKVLTKFCGYLIPTKRVPVEINGKIEWHDAKDYTRPGRTNGINSALADSVPRNRMIAQFVKMAYDKGRNIIIFSELRDKHLGAIELELLACGVKKHDIGWYVGGLTKAERERVKGKRVLLSTYKMASMATDIPWLDTCVLATPRTDVKQIVGRILREYDDKREPVVFDIVDTDCKLFVKYYNKRLKWYSSIGSKVVETK